MEKRKILFLCTGNYYRSRFAEETFNHLAKKSGLDWEADSAGLMVPESKEHNIGPISEHAIAALKRAKIPPLKATRFPSQATDEDFDRSALTIALCQREHQPMLNNLFPQRLNDIVFWHTEDIPLEIPEKATQQILDGIRRLIDRLSKNQAKQSSPPARP
ncbi:hypothetical protein VDG1235_3163 [Verrucomicrobiia bacterium DG1235]|nr:hypothetical protein VDG1235_3163 [Verrucomicrobiae bacterium DG1235]